MCVRVHAHVCRTHVFSILFPEYELRVCICMYVYTSERKTCSTRAKINHDTEIARREKRPLNAKFQINVTKEDKS